MKYLLIILLLPLFTHAQSAAGAAQYTSYTVPKYGDLVNSDVLNNTQKAAITKDTLNCDYARSVIELSSWNGSNSQTVTFHAKGLTIQPVLNYGGAGRVPFATSAQLNGYGDTIALVLDTYTYIKSIVIENEAINDVQFHSGPLSDYGGMLATAYPIAHSRGVEVSESGVYGSGLDIKVYRWLVTKYNQSTADQYGAACMNTTQINAAKTPNSNPTLEETANKIDTIVSFKAYYDFCNIHPYEVFSRTNLQPDTVTQAAVNVVRYQKEYMEAVTGKPCITNEMGQRDSEHPELTTNMMQVVYRIGMQWVLWYNGTGLGGAFPLTNITTGEILPMGTAFKNFVNPPIQN